MLNGERPQHRIVINGITYIRQPQLVGEFKPKESSPSLFKTVVLGSLLPLLVIYVLADWLG